MRARWTSAVSEELLRFGLYGRAAERLFVLALCGLVSSCTDGRTRSPFSAGGAGGVGGAFGSGASGGSILLGTGGVPLLGEACVDDAQCDDKIACTLDACDRSLGRCRFLPDPTRCQDEIFCNGGEVCEPGLGCRAGLPVHCSDNSTCTIDRCVEETRTCESLPRDADGDRDPVWNCGGTDCDDTNPFINGNRTEVCENTRDDDCDQQTDEEDCTRPAHDTCADALVVEGSGSYPLSLTAAKQDVLLGCVKPSTSQRDVVIALTVPEGAPLDVDLWVVSDDETVGLSLATECGAGGEELACSSLVPLPASGVGGIARLLVQALDPGVYPLYVSGSVEQALWLDVRYGPATEGAPNETCGTALELFPGQNVLARVAAAGTDLQSACKLQRDLVYRFELEGPSDVTLTAAPLDGFGDPVLSLRSQACSSLGAELDCRSGVPGRLFTRALPKGEYFVAIGASGPGNFDLRLDLTEPSEAPPSQGCVAPPKLDFGTNLELDLRSHTNAMASSCLAGAVDATFGFSLPERSDVLVVERMSQGDDGAISLLSADCESKTALLCTASSSPVRTRAFGLPAGEYHAVAESRIGNPIALSAFRRPALPLTLVPFADTCDQAVVIPQGGGRFSGNTSNVDADYPASCDFGGVDAGGAPEQMLKLSLSEPRRVVLDLAGSDFATLLVVRKGTDCPGAELPLACAPGRREGRSFLDLELAAGEYFIQIDGYGNASGHWLLDVYEVSL